jgi:hypothetical protein
MVNGEFGRKLQFLNEKEKWSKGACKNYFHFFINKVQQNVVQIQHFAIYLHHNIK